MIKKLKILLNKNNRKNYKYPLAVKKNSITK